MPCAEVTKAISAPLSACVKGFPVPDALHPFERALLDLTLGLNSYQRRLGRVAAMRQACVEVSPALQFQHSLRSAIKSSSLVQTPCHGGSCLLCGASQIPRDYGIPMIRLPRTYR